MDLVSESGFTELDLDPSQLLSFLEDKDAQLPLTIVLTAIGICADVALIYLGFFNKKYRTPTNILIGNWAVSNLLHLLAIRLVAKFFPFAENTPEGLGPCALNQSIDAFKCAEVIFLILLVGHWHVSAFNAAVYNRLRGNLTIVILFFWIASVGIGVMLIGGCVIKIAELPQIIFEGLFFVMAALLIKTHSTIVLRQYNRNTELEQSTVPLNLTSLFVFVWGGDAIKPFIPVNPWVNIIADSLIPLSPAMVIALLFGFDDNFKRHGTRILGIFGGNQKLIAKPNIMEISEENVTKNIGNPKIAKIFVDNARKHTAGSKIAKVFEERITKHIDQPRITEIFEENTTKHTTKNVGMFDECTTKCMKKPIITKINEEDATKPTARAFQEHTTKCFDKPIISEIFEGKVTSRIVISKIGEIHIEDVPTVSKV